MFRLLLSSFFLAVVTTTNAQDYAAGIEKHRKEYKEEFLTFERSPLKEEDLSFIQFYAPDESYVINATFQPTPDEKAFDMATYSGVTKKYIKYGTFSFTLNGKKLVLHVYQGLALIKDPQYADYLFIPFKDFTNGVETYGGGRYLDFRIGDIHNNILKIDFNLAYNPYCAYSSGYSCPIPPEENHLEIEIKAGERKFGKDH